MSHDMRRDGRDKLTRKTEPDDLEAQVKALKELQKQPGFLIKKSASKKKGHGPDGIFKRILGFLARLFSGNSHHIS